MKLPLHRRRFCSFLLPFALAVPLGAAELDTVVAGARQDLDRALAELAALREHVETARIPLARRQHELEDQVLAERARLASAKRSADNQLVELNALKAEARGLSNQVAVAEGLLSAYREAFNNRLHVSEVPLYEAAVRSSFAAREALEASATTRLSGQLALLETGLDRLERAIGGQVFAGQALNPSGKRERGQFILLGPTACFASEDSELAGVAVLRLNSPEPEVATVPSSMSAGIRAVAGAGAGTLPLDASLGNALKIQATRDSLWVHISKGGPVMVPILLLGLVAIGIFAGKWWQVARVRVAAPEDLKLILTSIDLGEREKAAQQARRITGPVGQMLEAAIAHMRERKEYVEEVMYEKMLETRPKLEKLLPFLALSAAAAPLLGLLGTVTGMINTFNMITVFGTGDPKTLAGGISEALITTEFGLVVAIPSLLLHAVLSRKVKAVLGSMEQTTVAFINGLPSSSEETQFFTKAND